MLLTPRSSQHHSGGLLSRGIITHNIREQSIYLSHTVQSLTHWSYQHRSTRAQWAATGGHCSAMCAFAQLLYFDCPFAQLCRGRHTFVLYQQTVLISVLRQREKDLFIRPQLVSESPQLAGDHYLVVQWIKCKLTRRPNSK